jgi:hypothetical protein
MGTKGIEIVYDEEKGILYCMGQLEQLRQNKDLM